MKKRMLSIIMALILCQSFLPTAALAAESENAHDIWVGGVQITDANVGNVLGDGTVSYDAESNTLSLEDADLSAGYEYEENCVACIYAAGDLSIVLEGASGIVAADAAKMSFGIRVKGNLDISGTGTLRVAGGNVSAEDSSGESVGIRCTNSLYISEAAVEASGGNVSAIGAHAAYSSGVYAGDIDLDYGARLTAVGGKAEGYEAFSTGLEACGDEDTYINVAVRDCSLEAVGGEADGVIYAGSTGINVRYGGLYVYDSTAEVTLSGGSSKVISTNEEDEPYAHSNGIYVHSGDVGIDAGKVSISGGSWSGFYGDGHAAYIRAQEEVDEEGNVTGWSGGYLSVSSEGYIFGTDENAGTRLSLSASNGMAVYAEMGIELDDTLKISIPEEGTVIGVGGSADPENWVEPDYYTFADKVGTEAKNVSIETIAYYDVDPDMGYREAVEYVIDRGLMNGVAEGSFDPKGSTSRAMLVTILWRLEGEPVVNYLMQYEDVKAETWYTEAVRWAAAEGIVEGYSDTEFGPVDAVSREQLVTILWRYAKYLEMDVSVGEDTNILSYEDAFEISEWAIPAMQWACGSGVIEGDGARLEPEAEAARAQCAAMLMRFCDLDM